MKVKQFSHCDMTEIEKAINKFLETGVHVCFVTHAETLMDGDAWATILVWYNEDTEEEEKPVRKMGLYADGIEIYDE